ncbi:MAG: hypothetical protein ACRD2N_20280 [Vicinamibacterales bacterium]
MRTRKAVLLLSIMGAVTVGAARLTQSLSERDHDEAARITRLSSGLFFRGDEADAGRRLAEMDWLTDRLQREVDRYIQTTFTVAHDPDGIQRRLRTLLGAHAPNPEFGDLPFTRLAGLRFGSSLIVAYTLVRGPHHNLATIRGYRATREGFELVATTGDDFEGYGMFKAELQSPIDDEFWLMAWGQAHTFDGRRVRFRIYAFDGEAFKTMWSPEDLFDAEDPHITGLIFSIDHRVRQPRYDIHDEYLLTASGPIKTK